MFLRYSLMNIHTCISVLVNGNISNLHDGFKEAQMEMLGIHVNVTMHVYV